MQKIVRCLLLSLSLFLFLSANAHAGERGQTLGYGFAALNNRASVGEVEGGKTYNFIQVTYLYENPYWKKSAFVVEPFANQPGTGVDGGFNLLMRWYPSAEKPRSGLYFDVGAGAAYTSISFQEQGTHLLGILVGGVGFRYDSLFIEDRFRHYSNDPAYPNRSVNSNILSLGKYF